MDVRHSLLKIGTSLTVTCRVFRLSEYSCLRTEWLNLRFTPCRPLLLRDSSLIGYRWFNSRKIAYIVPVHLTAPGPCQTGYEPKSISTFFVQDVERSIRSWWNPMASPGQWEPGDPATKFLVFLSPCPLVIMGGDVHQYQMGTSSVCWVLESILWLWLHVSNQTEHCAEGQIYRYVTISLTNEVWLGSNGLTSSWKLSPGGVT